MILKKRPLVVGTLLGTASVSSQLKKAREASVDLVEVRLDTFLPLPSQPLIQNVRSLWPRPIILTLRSYKEAGVSVPRSRRLTDSVRFGLIKPLLPLVQWVDVEIRHTALASALTRLAHRSRVKVIHSYHDFKKVGPWPLVQTLARTSQKEGGDVFKVAVQPRDRDQLHTFLNQGSQLPHPHKILIGMGRVGLPSRWMGFSFGSVMTFGHLGVSAAPGQIPVKELVQGVRDIYV